MADINENTIVSIDSFIIGTAQIPIIANTPTTPTAFFKILLAPKTVSTASPKILPTTGTKVDTAVFVTFEVTPSILADKLPSKEIAPISTVNTIPRIHKLEDLKYFDNLPTWTFSDILDIIPKDIPININGKIKFPTILLTNWIANRIKGCTKVEVAMFPWGYH